MTILIAQPYRAGSNPQWVAMAQRHVDGLLYRDIEHVQWPNQFERAGGKYTPHAQARNAFIEQFLKAWHAWVWWLDIDLTSVPADSPGRLLDVAEQLGGRAIVAPAVYVEMRNGGAPSMDNGGWFYDVGGFTDDGGRWLHPWNGLRGRAAVCELNSVGIGSLVPAEVYRRGVRYAPQGDEVEHVGFCERARTLLGIRSYAAQGVRLEHAYLPAYGEEWH